MRHWSCLPYWPRLDLSNNLLAELPDSGELSFGASASTWFLGLHSFLNAFLWFLVFKSHSTENPLRFSVPAVGLGELAHLTRTTA